METGTTDVIFKPRRLGHANLWVEDLKRFEEWYGNVCGLNREFWEPDLVASFLGTGNTPHDLGAIQVTGGKARYGRDGLLQIPEGIGTTVGLGHLAWEMQNERDLVESYKRAKTAGIAIHMTVDHQVAHSIYLPDPDNNVIEFYCDTVKDWRRVLQGEMALITGAWTPGETEPFTDSRFDETPEIRTLAAAPIHPRRVTHAVLTTQNMPELVRFYRSVAGMVPVYSAADGSVVCLAGTAKGYRFHLAICAHNGAGRSGYHHLAFELADTEATDEAEKAVRQRGINPEATVDNKYKRGFFLRDPDGMRVEFYARRTDAFPDLSREDPAMKPFLI